MNGLITEGIPLGINVQILTSGLSFGEPIPPTPVATSSGLLNLGITFPLVSNKTGSYTSPYYNLPATMTKLTAQVKGTITSVNIQGSLDGINFVQIFDFSAAGMQTIETNMKWVRAITSGTGITVLINPRREKF